MKTVILLLLTTFNAFAVAAQQVVPNTPPPRINPVQNEIVRRNHLHAPASFSARSQAGFGMKIDIRTINSPQLLTALIRSSPLSEANPLPGGQTPLPSRQPAGQQRPTVAVPQNPATRSRNLGATCNNHSFLQLIGFTNGVMYAGAMTHTQDDGVILCGTVWDSTATHPSWQQNGFILKCDNQGNILWLNLLVDPANDPIYSFSPILIKEMPGGDLVMAAYVDYSPTGNQQEVTTIYHLSSGGATLWHKELESTLMQWDNNEWTYFAVKGINPGLNGDYILSGTTVAVNYGAQALTVVRLDAGGNLIWDLNLGNRASDYDLDAEGLNAYLSGNQIMAIGITHGNEFPFGNAATFFATLDYNSGTVLNKRFWMNNYSNSNTNFEKSPTYYYDYAVRLNNGNYKVYTTLFSAFTLNTDTIDFFGIQEYDPTGTQISAYTLSAAYQTQYYNDNIYFDNNGNGYLSIASSANASTEGLFFAKLLNDQIVRQRIQHYSNNTTADYSSSTSFMNDGATMVSTSYYDPASGSWMALKKMYDTDTASACLGRDTAILMKLPLDMIEDPTYYFLDPPLTGQIVPVTYAISPGSTAYTTKYPCLVNSSCSFLQIQGQTSACGTGQPLQFLALRNPGCGAIPLWSVDTSAIASITRVNDTTVSVVFKDTNWQGKLHADIPAGSCTTGLGDSVTLNITAVPHAPNLAPDTILCSGNSIVLHPGPVYSSYLWQDGSTDSTYTVTTPGHYSVAVTDACGDNYQASTQVVAANFPFTLGPAFSKCNQDTVSLKVTGGFANYQWSAAGVQQQGSDSVLTVDPLQTTTYVVTANKWPGCAVNANVKVTVLTSPRIQLGGDTSFCSGASKILDAGPGFNSYTWNTGQTTEQIVVNEGGIYTVAGTAPDGCASRDTFQVTTVYPTPQISLGGAADSSICFNQPIIYSFPTNGDQYQWSDGRPGPYRLIDTGGVYGLTVVNSFGCTTNQSITITVNPLPSVKLGGDTTLCQGTNVVLNPSSGLANSSYLWQDGSTAATYTVSTAGTYSVKATAADGCSASDTVQVSFTGVPDFSLGQDTVLCPGMVFMLKPSLAYAGNYLWQDGSTGDFMMVQDTGTYSLTTINSCGESKGIIHVTAGLCTLAMPNAFTPNGDGKNDVFRVRYPFAVSRFVMAIYDRWGRQVFRTTNIEEGWNGTVNGSPAPTGTYVWNISLTDFQHKDQYQKGTVILVR